MSWKTYCMGGCLKSATFLQQKGVHAYVHVLVALYGQLLFKCYSCSLSSQVFTMF